MGEVEFYLNNEEINSWLKNIGILNSEAILRKMRSKNSKDYLNLLAVIDELRIGALLSEFVSIKYDFKINGKTPDWYVEDTNTIVEVRGTNQIEKDLIRDKFEDKLRENIRKIQGSFFVSIEYADDEDVSFFKKFDHEDFILKFSDWFSNNNSTGSEFKANGVRISILNNENGLDNLEVGIGNFNTINIKTGKLVNIIDEKLKEYKELISKVDKEFIIAIVSDIKNGLSDIDLQSLLYGPSVYNKKLNTKYSTLDGLYYNPGYSEYISGIIFMIRGQKPNFFKNYSHKKNELSNKIEKYVAQQSFVG